MGNKTIVFSLETDKTLGEVKDALKKSLTFLGGTLLEQGDAFHLQQGTNGINFSFAANFNALINIRQTSTNKYEFLASVNWSPNGLFWGCLIAGLFVFITLIVPLLYLFIDPFQAYQQAFVRVQSFL